MHSDSILWIRTIIIAILCLLVIFIAVEYEFIYFIPIVCLTILAYLSIKYSIKKKTT